MKWRALVFASSCTLVAGCGGGSQSSSPTEGGTLHTTTVGGATVAYEGKLVPAAVFSQAGVTVASMAGASFSKVILTPAPKKENSAIVFSLGGQIWSYQNGVQTQITTGLHNFQNPTVAKNGVVFFSGYDYNANRYEIYTCNLDGSAFKKVTSTTINHVWPSVSPSGSRIAFSNNAGEIYTVNSDGTGETIVNIPGANPQPGVHYYPAWSPDGTRLAFMGYDPGESLDSIYTVPYTGGTATEVTVGYPSSCFQPRWSPDSTEVAYVVGTTQSTIDYVDVGAVGSPYSVAIPPSGVGYSNPSFSPDGATVAFVSSSSSLNAIDTQLLSSRASLTTIVDYPSSSQAPITPFWSPFFGPKTFIGTGGQMSTAAGFVWAQLGDGFGGFASISATTPSKLTIVQQPSGTNGGALVYLASADAITKIVYSNSYFGALNTVSPTSTAQALISVSTITGQVDTVAPLAEPARSVAGSPGAVAYEGKFTGIFDARGKNLAPAGARHVEIDRKTGKLSSWR